MPKVQFLLPLSLPFLLLGCAGNGEKFSYLKPQAEHNAVVYLYRSEAPNPGRQPLSGEYPEVFLNGESVGVLPPNRYIALEVKPGRYQLRFSGLTPAAKWSQKDLKRTFSVRHSEQKYLRFQVRYDPDSLGLLERTRYLQFLTPMDHDDAIYDIQSMRRQR